MRNRPSLRSSAPLGQLLVATMAFAAGCTGSVSSEEGGAAAGAAGSGTGGQVSAGAGVGNAGVSAGGTSSPAGGGAAGSTAANPPAVPRAHPGEEFACDPGSATPGPSLVRRLTATEYINSVEHALSIKIQPLATTELPAEVASSGFDNDANALVVSYERVAAYERLATLIAGQLGDPAAFVARFSDCSTMTEACQTKLIDSLGRKLLRGAVQPAERTAFLALYQAAQAEAASYVEASTLVLRAMLQSPRFIYRIEKERGDGSVQAVSATELASRISYALWQAPPDDALVAAADTGKLEQETGVAAEVQRMLQDPRAYVTASTFFSDWLDLRRLDTLQRSADAFPGFDNALHADMKQETTALFEAVWKSKARLTSLYDLESTTVSQALAKHYGLPSPREGVATYDLTAVPTRGGLLTHGSILAIGGEQASSVMRGLFFIENVLCSEIVAPPASADTTPPPLGAGVSRRTVSAARVANPACGGCHSQMEQPVWGLIRYSATGVYSEKDEFGNELPADGEIRFPGQQAPAPYADVAELSRVLAQSERARDCLTLKIAQYALGRSPAGSESCALDAARQVIASSPGTYGDMIGALSQTDLFRRLKTQTN